MYYLIIFVWMGGQEASIIVEKTVMLNKETCMEARRTVLESAETKKWKRFMADAVCVEGAVTEHGDK